MPSRVDLLLEVKRAQFLAVFQKTKQKNRILHSNWLEHGPDAYVPTKGDESSYSERNLKIKSVFVDILYRLGCPSYEIAAIERGNLLLQPPVPSHYQQSSPPQPRARELVCGLPREPSNKPRERSEQERQIEGGGEERRARKGTREK